MLGAIIGIIVTLIILGVIWWAAQQLLALIPLAEPFATLVRICITVLMVLVVLWVFIQLLGIAGIHVPLLGSGIR
jgi:hypothetical protein